MNDIARDFVAGFRRVRKFRVVFVQLPNQNLNVGKNRVAANKARFHKLFDVNGRFAANYVTRDNFCAFARQKNVFVAVVLFVGKRVD